MTRKPQNERALPAAPGIADEAFARGGVPLTKEEIRCLTLAKLRLRQGQRILEIGAGSGGLTVECALLVREGSLWAVERDKEALSLIHANLTRFAVTNVTVIPGSAPEVLKGLGPFERVLIGGSGGKLAPIIERVTALLLPGGIVVINCILFETLTTALMLLERCGFEEIGFIQAQISRSRPIGGGTALQPLNPVFILSARRGL